MDSKKKKVVEFLSLMEAWKTNIKELHWSAVSLSQHKLADDIADTLAEFQDKVGEIQQGITGKFKVGTLKHVEYKQPSFKLFLEDVYEKASEFEKFTKEAGDKYVGMHSETETFLGEIQKDIYLVEFTLKEELKRRFKKQINESEEDAIRKMFGSINNSHQLTPWTEKGREERFKSHGTPEQRNPSYEKAKREAQERMRLKKENRMQESYKISESELYGLIREAVSSVLSQNLNEVDVKGGDYSDNELNYTHFAVNKANGLIVDGWDYSGYDSGDLKAHKRDYFYDDLENNGFNPKAYKILSFKACQKQGIDPNNKQIWSNTGVYPLETEKEMKNNGQDFYSAAIQEHPDWFVE